MDKINKIIEEYLKKQFPKKKLQKLPKIHDKNYELYGIMSIQIKVIQVENDIFYQVIKKK